MSENHTPTLSDRLAYLQTQLGVLELALKQLHTAVQDGDAIDDCTEGLPQMVQAIRAHMQPAFELSDAILDTPTPADPFEGRRRVN